MKYFLLLLILTFTLSVQSKEMMFQTQDTTSFDINILIENVNVVYSTSNQKTNLQKVGIQPYVFNKYISGTGEEFVMGGVYVNLYQSNIKLNINNISGDMFTTLPWAMLSLSLKI